ncbi:MAG: Uma2 family endonuclease, partial [Cyanobacteria bacterium J06636_16]
IQAKLVNAIDTVAVSNKIALALPELRCSFGGLAIVPDVAVFKWERVPFTEAGFVPNDFEIAPDWAVEILSPNQSPSKPVRKLAHCLQHGTEVGWLIDPGGLAVTAFYPNQIPVVLEDSDKLPTLSGVPLELTVDDVFGWLRIA